MVFFLRYESSSVRNLRDIFLVTFYEKYVRRDQDLTSFASSLQISVQETQNVKNSVHLHLHGRDYVTNV